jgi:hypothetical protein
MTASISLAFTCLGSTSATAAADLSYLQGLLASTPEGGWVQVNTNKFSDAWPYSGWRRAKFRSSGHCSCLEFFCLGLGSWRPTAFGGGHANYAGNEMYVWQGSDGAWTRGSLPSRLERYGTTSTFLRWTMLLHSPPILTITIFMYL